MIPLVSSFLSLLTLTNVFLPECQDLALENGGKQMELEPGLVLWVCLAIFQASFPGAVRGVGERCDQRGSEVGLPFQVRENPGRAPLSSR